MLNQNLIIQKNQLRKKSSNKSLFYNELNDDNNNVNNSVGSNDFIKKFDYNSDHSKNNKDIIREKDDQIKYLMDLKEEWEKTLANYKSIDDKYLNKICRENEMNEKKGYFINRKSLGI